MYRHYHLTEKQKQRIWSKVQVTDGCWEWLGSHQAGGYAQCGIGSQRAGTRSMGVVHRAVYQMVVGPIPSGLSLDHLCRNRGCVNPFHLEPIPIKVNILRGNGWGGRHKRKTHCPAGHPYTGSNLYTLYTGSRDGHRFCRTCDREKHRRQRERDRPRRTK